MRILFVIEKAIAVILGNAFSGPHTPPQRSIRFSAGKVDAE
jgi:hypothetical protein